MGCSRNCHSLRDVASILNVPGETPTARYEWKSDDIQKPLNNKHAQICPQILSIYVVYNYIGKLVHIYG